MPRGDRTGPSGEGPATGRGMGPCVTEGQLEKQRGKGLGRGGAPKGGGKGHGGGKGRRKGAGGITYFT